jgi:hypothetical protein
MSDMISNNFTFMLSEFLICLSKRYIGIILGNLKIVHLSIFHCDNSTHDFSIRLVVLDMLYNVKDHQLIFYHTLL